MLKSMLLRTLVLSFCCSLSLSVASAMNGEENEDLSHSVSASQHPMPENQWLELPDEVWVNVFDRLSFKDLVQNIPLVCHRFKATGEDQQLFLGFATPHQVEEVKDKSGNVDTKSLKQIIVRDKKRAQEDPIYFYVKNNGGKDLVVTIGYEYSYNFPDRLRKHYEMDSSEIVNFPSKGKGVLRKSDFRNSTGGEKLLNLEDQSVMAKTMAHAVHVHIWLPETYSIPYGGGRDCYEIDQLSLGKERCNPFQKIIHIRPSSLLPEKPYDYILEGSPKPRKDLNK